MGAIVQVTVQLRPDAAEEVRSSAPSSDAAHEVVRVASEHGVELRPVVSGPGSEVLRATFVTEAPGEEEAVQLSEALRGLEAVEAAYVKPPDALP